MKWKILAIVIGLVIISSIFIGCKKEELLDVTNPEKPEVPTQPAEPKEDGPGEYIMGLGDDISVSGKNIKFMNLDEDGEVTLSVDGQKTVVYGTYTPYIIDGIEVNVKRAAFKPNPDDITITLVVSLVRLAEDEYLLYVDKPVNVKGKTVTLKNVKSNDMITLTVDRSGSFDLAKGDSKEVEGLKVTNTEPGHRPVRYESYAILTIV